METRIKQTKEEHKMTTAYTPYRDMQSELEQLQNICGRSVTAINTGRSYAVLSYGTPILIYCMTTGETIFDNSYYSTTTSRLQNLIKNAFELHDFKERKIYDFKLQTLSV